MATVTRIGNTYTVVEEGTEGARFDRPIKKAQVNNVVVEFPSIYGYPITLPHALLTSNIIVHEYGEAANEHYWEPQNIPQGV